MFGSLRRFNFVDSQCFETSRRFYWAGSYFINIYRQFNYIFRVSKAAYTANLQENTHTEV